jgi:hypothetical protein
METEEEFNWEKKDLDEENAIQNWRDDKEVLLDNKTENE